jgi:hypothetical protein
MTNLEIIKYLALTNPTRLAELLDDIYCIAWNNGSYAGSNGEGKILEECEIDDFNEWIKQDAAESGFYFDEELEQWSKAINPTPTIEAFYGSKSKVIEQAIDEIDLLENVIETTKHSDIDYVRFRKSVCAYCSDVNCMRGQMEICDCHKFENYYEI